MKENRNRLVVMGPLTPPNRTRPYVPKTILKRLRGYFPGVNKVVDALEDITVSVTKEDSDNSQKKDPAHCAFANALCRQGLADGALVNIGIAYLIKGKTAIRFKTSQSVAREIISFDRHHDFAPGKSYKLCKINSDRRLGAHKFGSQTQGNKKPKQKHGILHHRTSGIRATTSIRPSAVAVTTKQT